MRSIGIILFILSILAAGCSANRRPQASTEGVKMSDLAPIDNMRDPGIDLLESVNVEVAVFEVPAGNISMLEDVWESLAYGPVRYKKPGDFDLNGFRAAFGRGVMINDLLDAIKVAGGEKTRKISMVILKGSSEKAVLRNLVYKRDVFYTLEGAVEDVSLGPGVFLLAVKADRLSWRRGLCSISVTPACCGRAVSLKSVLRNKPEADCFEFSNLTAEWTASPGDFVLLGSHGYIDNDVTVSGMLFSRPHPFPVSKLYLISCSGIVQ